MQRKIDLFLEDFFKTQKKALLLTGARQVGKTYAVRQFGTKNFENFIELNFIENPGLKSIFQNVGNVEEIILRLSSEFGNKMIPKKTLIFFDEIQECEEIVTIIKFLVEEGSYSYILSGSLLGVELKDLRSVPVGFLAIKQMYPLDFEEFLTACGINQNIFSALKNCFEKLIPVDDFIHKKILSLFRLYLVVGGMPEVVLKYLETNNLFEVWKSQNYILELYKKDISKYDKKNKLYLNEIFELLPAELNEKNKRFILKKLNENIKFSRYENSFIWLKDAGVALPTYNVQEPKTSLILSKSRNLFKLFQSDVGLLACQYDSSIQLKIINHEINLNYGGIYENAVAQELKAHGFDLYYFNSKTQGEVDFIIEQDSQVIPIEVKSGKYYERHNALLNLLNNQEYEIKKSFVLCNDNLKIAKKIIYLPIYMIMFIQKNQEKKVIYKLDIEGLN